MKTNFTLTAAVLLFSSISSIAQVFRNTKPVIIKGQVYDVVLQVSPSQSDTSDDKIITANFNLLADANTSFASFEQSGGHQQIRKVYVVNSDYVNKKKVNLLPDLSTPTDGALRNFTRCYVRMNGKEPKIILSNGNDAEKINVSFTETQSNLFKVDHKDVLPTVKYISETEEEEPATATTVEAPEQPHNHFANASASAASFHFAGDIDNNEFPDNSCLRKYLANNNDFVFKLTKDLYLDMMRFRAINYEYDRKKLMNFLHLHDLWFNRYARNESVLEKKLQACIDVLRNACEKFNRGDVFYKDYSIDMSKVDLNSKPFSLLQPDSEKDDYYATKRIKGETDQFYSENALNVYLTNWASLSDPGARSTQQSWLSRMADSIPQQLTLRMYFLIQPSAAFASDGSFKGVTAYGLKAVLFKDCPSNYIATIDNKYINKIEDDEARGYYAKASEYITKLVKTSGFGSNINTNVLYANNYSALGDWHQVYDQCQEGYTYLSGRVTNSGSDAILSLRMITNYDYTVQPGNKVTISNRMSEVSFTLPVEKANFIQGQSTDGYYNISIRIPQEMMQKMTAANVNTITLISQSSSGQPGRISAPIETSAQGKTVTLVSLLSGTSQQSNRGLASK